jgi:hypothetical protein
MRRITETSEGYYESLSYLTHTFELPAASCRFWRFWKKDRKF